MFDFLGLCSCVLGLNFFFFFCVLVFDFLGLCLKFLGLVLVRIVVVS